MREKGRKKERKGRGGKRKHWKGKVDKRGKRKERGER